jgi:hypothetical protein
MQGYELSRFGRVIVVKPVTAPYDTVQSLRRLVSARSVGATTIRSSVAKTIVSREAPHAHNRRSDSPRSATVTRAIHPSHVRPTSGAQRAPRSQATTCGESLRQLAKKIARDNRHRAARFKPTARLTKAYDHSGGIADVHHPGSLYTSTLRYKGWA